MNMRILWITLESILPANSGGRIGVFKRLEQLAKTEKIYLFYPYDAENDVEYVSELKELCVEVHPYSRRNNKKYAMLHLADYPYTVGSRCIPQMQKDIETCIKENAIDVINVDFPHMCVNLLNINTQLPIVLNEHNIEWKVYKRITQSKKGLGKIAYGVDSYRLRSFEKKVFRKLNISKVTFVSDKDMEEMILANGLDRDKCDLIPVGADVRDLNTEKIKLSDNNIIDTHNIIFVGKMSYGPNIEAVSWFANSIFPQIQKEFPNSKFYIVGKDPAEDVKNLARDNIIITGAVDAVEPYYELADLVVLPLKNGGGVKVKLLEAISYKKPIVSTSVGVEGTLYSDGKLIPIADSTNEFARACIEILDPGDAEGQREAYEIFLSNYTWQSVCKKYISILKETVGLK